MKGQLAPSILSFDLPNLIDSVKELEELGSDVLHLDVMDGQFVPPISFGASYVKALRPHTRLPFEAHLMTLTPERHFEDFAAAGCDRILFHVETGPHTHRHCQTLRSMGLQSGVVLNPGTPVEAAIEVLDVVDMVLVMTVNPGWGGQPFLATALDKVARLREAKPDLDIEVDGGVVPETLALARRAGANVFVVGNYLASAPDRRVAMEHLRAQCGSAS